MPLIQSMFQPTMDVGRIDDEADGRFRLKATGGGFLARLFGMGSRATLTIDAHGFRIQKTAFGSDEDTYVPRPHVASTICVVTKPVEYLLLGILTLPLFGLGLIFLLVYFFSKRRVIVGVVSSGGTVESLKLKASDTDLAEIREGVRLLERLLRGDEDDPRDRDRDDRRPAAGRGSFTPPPPPPRAPVAVAADTTIITCPSCGARMSIPPSAAGKRVRCSSCREVFPAAAD